MMMSRAYIGPWGKNGIKNDAYGRGMGTMGVQDTTSSSGYINTPNQTQYPSMVQSNSPSDPTALNNAAKAALINAGYAGAECHTEKVFTPDGNFYTQNICAAPGYSGGDEANLVLAMSPAQLAAQRAYEVAQGAGTSATPDYFQWTAGAANIQISNPTNGAIAPYVSKPDVLPALTPGTTPQQQIASQVPKSTTTVTAGSTTPAVVTSASSFDFASLLSGNNLYYLLGAGAVLFFMFGGKKR